MRTICATGATVKGIDIYHGDLISDINKVIAAGFEYAYLKAWEYSKDPSFASRWTALNGKMARGAYDFFHPSKDPIAQANGLLSCIGQLQEADLPCALDWESTDGVPSSADREAGLAWLTHVEKVSGKTPVIYGSPYFLDALALDSRFSRFGLWIAEYGVSCPKVSDVWKNWDFWQGSEAGSVPGMVGPCDTDVFNGDFIALKLFIANSKVK